MHFGTETLHTSLFHSYILYMWTLEILHCVLDWCQQPRGKINLWNKSFISSFWTDIVVLNCPVVLPSLTRRGGSWVGCRWSGPASSGRRRCGSSPADTATDTARGTGGTPAGARWRSPRCTGCPNCWGFLRPSAIRTHHESGSFSFPLQGCVSCQIYF